MMTDDRTVFPTPREYTVAIRDFRPGLYPCSCVIHGRTAARAALLVLPGMYGRYNTDVVAYLLQNVIHGACPEGFDAIAAETGFSRSWAVSYDAVLPGHDITRFSILCPVCPEER